MFCKLLLIQTILFTEALAFNGLQVPTSTIATKVDVKGSQSSSLFPPPRQGQRTPSSLSASSAALTPPDASGNSDSSSPGFLGFKTKYGYLNPYAIYYGVTSILLGIPWFIALNFCQLLYKISGNKLDKLKRLPTFFSQVWGVTLMRLTRSYPDVVGLDILDKFYKE